MSSILVLVLMLAIIFGLAGKLVYDGIKANEKKKIIQSISLVVVFLILILIMVLANK